MATTKKTEGKSVTIEMFHDGDLGKETKGSVMYEAKDDTAMATNIYCRKAGMDKIGGKEVKHVRVTIEAIG